MNSSELAPGLLLAMPHLADPNFERAVVFMVEHADEGSFGLVINQSSDLTAGEVFDSLEIPWSGPADDAVWSGGPVMPASGWVLHSPTDVVAIGDDSDTVLICPDIALSNSTDALTRLAATPPQYMRFVLGYSGWGPGQLITEMAAGSWLHAEANTKLVFETPAEDMWSAALKSTGIDPSSIVQAHGVH